jgi:hypothetical protein
MNLFDLIEASKCNTCAYRVSRVISPIGLDLVDDDGKSFQDDDELIHEFCVFLKVELDHCVLQCSAFKARSESSTFFKHDVFD